MNFAMARYLWMLLDSLIEGSLPSNGVSLDLAIDAKSVSSAVTAAKRQGTR